MNRFTRWRRSCPCTAGVLAVAAGVDLVGVSPAYSGTGAAASRVFGALLVVAGLTVLFDPALRHSAGAVALIVGVLSLVVADLGGSLLAVLGGAPALSWVQVAEPTVEVE